MTGRTKYVRYSFTRDQDQDRDRNGACSNHRPTCDRRSSGSSFKNLILFLNK